MQFVAVGQDTPDRTVSPAAEAGLGVGWIDHPVPFHRSASGALMPLPTAVQAVPEVQDTPSSTLSYLFGFGVDWIDHTVPFHRSARVNTYTKRCW